jgi:hypothetical protein
MDVLKNRTFLENVEKNNKTIVWPTVIILRLITIKIYKKYIIKAP